VGLSRKQNWGNIRLANSPCSKGVYAGSKAAVTAITDTLRLELAPFGVKVVTVHTGAVNTNILTSTGTNFRLPPGSVYKGVEKEIAARAMGEDGTPRQAPAVYAENVVVDVLGGVNYPIWRGGYASIVKFTSSWFPASISVCLSTKSRMARRWIWLTIGAGLDVDQGNGAGCLEGCEPLKLLEDYIRLY
jgi:hypothetical protein